ncbi:mediator of RNA polymerase II transcription subunit 12 [Diachasma alloeum]|uniref:mediator of RNA polymerase II transcription subunit 12 n=1 Tax=Diachasma alloeum TaxID=454923 RepID=UPI0007383B2D|nr:mediator of RNA polymerase II transcription subunit 12 [Diachasma alloeum]
MSGEDSPLEEDETEVLVYVEFEGTARRDVFSNEKLQLDMIGLDMEHPVMRVNGRYYEGTYEDAVGTYMFFEKEKNPVVDDPVFDVPPKLKYSTKTRKVLKMKRVFVKPRLDVMEDSNHSQSVPNLEALKEAGVPPNYQEEALNLWKEMREERLEALNEYLEKQKIREEKRQKGIEPDSESDEESPFAMYKTKTNDGEVSPATGDASAVIDPGPSTSKGNISPLDPEPNENAQLPKSSSQIKNQGYLQVYSSQRAKRRVKKKPENTKDSRSKKDCAGGQVGVSESAPRDDDHQSKISEKIPGEPQREDGGSEESESDAMSHTSEANLQGDDVKYISDKKLDKEMKRQAKIREISERLKRTADEIKSKTNP